MVTVGARARGGLLRDLLRLAPGEETRVGLLVLYALAALGGVAALAVDTGQALFLGSQSRAAIPLLFALPAVVVPGSAMLYHMLSARLRPSTLCSGTNSALIIGILLCRALLQTPAGARLPALLAVVGCCAITATLTMLQFWDLAGALFRAPEDKRSFGLLTGVGIIATTATGAFVVALSEAVAVQDFLFVVAASLAVCLVCAQSIRSLTGDDAPGTGTRNLDLSTTLRSFSRVALTRWIALLLIIGAVVGSLANFQFSLALHNAYEGHPEDVLRSLGLLALGTGLLAGLLQWQGTNRFMEALGVGPALRVLPGGLAAAAVALLLGGGGLAAAVLPRAVDRLLRPTLNNTALNVLLLPIPGDLRQRTRLVRDGVLTPLASGLAGLLLVFGAGLDLWTWSLPMLAFVIVWVALVPPARRQYMAALTENMRKRRLNLDTTTIDESDGTVRVLRAALAQPDETQVLHALQLIATAPRIQWDTEVCTLLEHPSPEVRVAALRHLGRPGNVAASTAIRGLFTTGDAAVQAAAIEAFCAVAGPAATAQVSGFLQVASPAIQGAALRGLMQHGGLFGILDAIPQLNGMLRSADPAMRLEGARVLGALRVHQHRLIPLFDDVSAEVQAGAIRAAGELCQPELVPYLIAKLGQKGIGPAAADALVQYGTGIEPM
ncbi:MAG TPA: HEAT repeat domain-containing protein, partial [Chloroflexia bacterium]|nr:HEAT repeat domain-containing protein [Chloroflexia bacterium]